MRKLIAFFSLAILAIQGNVYAQYPPLEFTIEHTTAPLASTAEVDLFAGTNWQNITTFNGTITFDTTKITWDTVSYWGLTYPNLATFTYQGGGVLTFTWNSLITIGPTLSQGATIFTLRFNTVGNSGDVSAVAFTGSPQAMYWNNGFGWSGSNFAQTNGSVTLVCNNPVAGFSSSSTYYDVSFTDTSTAGTSYFWDFGDGNTSTQQNPTHTYGAGGTYTVCLTTLSACGADSVCHSVTVCNTPAAAFTNTSGSLTVDFTDVTTNSPTQWLWDFGDGNTSTQQNPTHSYSTPGTYTVCLTSTSPCGTDSSCQVLSVGCPAPAVAWSDSADGLNLYFTDQSSQSPTSWAWDFGDGNTSTQQNPSHSYALPGNYTVCLIASSICGADTLCNTLTVSCPTPAAAWSHSSSNLDYLFTDLSTGSPTSWYWTFGDGASSSQQNPSHSYSAPGTYSVCLTAVSVCGPDTSCSTVTVVCNTPVAAWADSAQGLDLYFTDLSSNGATSWAWDFGDGSTSTLQNPQHTYASDGLYTVCLYATNACGTDTLCDTVNVLGSAVGPGLDKGVKIYPNPAKDQVHVVSGTFAPLQVTLLGMRGGVLGSYSGHGEVNIPTERLARGTYILRIESEGERSHKLLSLE